MKIVLWERGNFPHKYRVTLSDGRQISFGNQLYQQYKDITPLRLYSNLDHNDKKRRENYRKRHMAIRLMNGKLAYKQKYSPSYLSLKYLW